jgi:hypothetical protein
MTSNHLVIERLEESPVPELGMERRHSWIPDDSGRDANRHEPLRRDHHILLRAPLRDPFVKEVLGRAATLRRAEI